MTKTIENYFLNKYISPAKKLQYNNNIYILQVFKKVTYLNFDKNILSFLTKAPFNFSRSRGSDAGRTKFRCRLQHVQGNVPYYRE